MTPYDIITRRRALAGLTQSALAVRVRISRDLLIDIECGRAKADVTPDIAERIFEALKLTREERLVCALVWGAETLAAAQRWERLAGTPDPELSDPDLLMTGGHH